MQGAPDLGSVGQVEQADGGGKGPEGGGPEGVVEGPGVEQGGGGPEGDVEGPGGEPGVGDAERAGEFEGSDPAALIPPSLSGEGYQVSLSLESSFQMADTGTPSIGAVGAEVGGASAQLNAVTTAVAEGGGAPISGGPEGTVSSRAGSPEPDTSAPSSGSEGDGASATAAAVSEEGGSGEAEGEVAASDASGSEESSSAEASGGESADDAGDGGGDEPAAGETAQEENGGDGDDGTSASGETEEGDTAEGETAGEEGAVGGDDGEGPSEKPKAPSAAVAVKRVDARRASQNLARGDAQATSRTLQGLNLPDLSGRKTPTPAAIANSLQQVRQRVISGSGPR